MTSRRATKRPHSAATATTTTRTTTAASNDDDDSGKTLPPQPPQVMVFRPTLAEFINFTAYIEHIESLGAHKAGIAKIIPPPEWKARPNGYGPFIDGLTNNRTAATADNQASTSSSTASSDPIADLLITAPIIQEVSGRCGHYQQLNVQRKSLTVRQFHALATSPRYATPRVPATTHDDDNDDAAAANDDDSCVSDRLERLYWRNIAYVAPIYGADVPGSLMSARSAGAWNPHRLRSLLDLVPADYNVSIAGVNSAYLYFGMWKASFAWHTEDMDLYSLNYLHFGAAKTWYAVPPAHGRRLERLADRLFGQQRRGCSAHLRHKMSLMAPAVLRRAGVHVERVEQRAGEFVVTFPYGYHAGYNQGFNCAEASNFATHSWIEYGKRATQCHCDRDVVRINMDTFVRRFQPELWAGWERGVEEAAHPEDDGVERRRRGRDFETVQRPPAEIVHICSPTKRSCAGTFYRSAAQKPAAVVRRPKRRPRRR